MVFSMATSSPMHETIESERRRPGACGIPVVLSDGQTWLFASPSYRLGSNALTRPAIDDVLDRIFETAVLHESVSLCDLWEVASSLLTTNYVLSNAEVERLLAVSPGHDCRVLADAVLGALFGEESTEKTYTDWVRASLIANRLDQAEIAGRDLSNTLAILVATNRTVPLSRFADACRELDERARLETLL